jgi:hypothetical protein
MSYSANERPETAIGEPGKGATCRRLNIAALGGGRVAVFTRR